MPEDAHTHAQNTLFQHLRKSNIHFETFSHKPVFHVTDAHHHPLHKEDTQTKNLFLRAKTGEFFLLSALAKTHIQLNKIHKLLSCGRLSFAKEKDLFTLLGVTPGSVTPFALLKDEAYQVHVLLDHALFQSEKIGFHPLRNDQTTLLSPKDLLTWIKTTGHAWQCIDFHQLCLVP